MHTLLQGYANACIHTPRAAGCPAHFKVQCPSLSDWRVTVHTSHLTRPLDTLVCCRQETQKLEDTLARSQSTQRTQFNQTEALSEQSIVDRKIARDAAVRRLRRDTSLRVRAAEIDWQGRAQRWLTVARKKMELKQREDAEELARSIRRK